MKILMISQEEVNAIQEVCDAALKQDGINKVVGVNVIMNSITAFIQSEQQKQIEASKKVVDEMNSAKKNVDGNKQKNEIAEANKNKK